VNETRLEKEAPARKRWDALDDLRGLAILIMIPVNVAAPYAGIPAWFKHAPADGLTVADLVVPLFLFSLGMSAGFSWRRRVAERGYGRTLLHAVIRNALLCAFGVAGMLLADPGDRWEVLTMLGVTGMFSFFFLGLRPLPRIAAGLLLLTVVEVLRPLGLGDLIVRWYDTGLGGPWGTVSLSFFPIVASALGELAVEQTPSGRLTILGFGGLLMAAAGAAALAYVPFSKHILSLSYVLFTAGLSAVILALLAAGREMVHVRLPFLDAMGRNPLLLYMLHSVLGLGALALFAAGSPEWLAWTSAGGVLVICVLTAVVLDWRKLYLKL
jgi:predicted acyltransferase